MRVTKCLPYPEPFPNHTLLSDWDVTHQIADTLRQTAILLTLKHVKGHQDDTTPYRDLSLEAKLNVDADEEAGEYQVMSEST